jgi:hypothetical protein
MNVLPTTASRLEEMADQPSEAERAFQLDGTLTYSVVTVLCSFTSPAPTVLFRTFTSSFERGTSTVPSCVLSRGGTLDFLSETSTQTNASGDMDFLLDERLFTAQWNLDHLFLKCRFASLDFGPATRSTTMSSKTEGV